MNAVTELIFEHLGDVQLGSCVAVCDALTERGVQPQFFSEQAYRFEYQDEENLTGLLSFSRDNQVTYVSLMITWEGDEKGWSSWSEEREKERLERQTRWLQQRGFHLGCSKAREIKNSFCLKSGFSSITILPVKSD